MKSGVLALLSLVPLVIALVLPASARAAPKRIAVLEFTNEAGLSSFEIETLADDVRGAALVLPSGGFTVMTRESMMAMLPPGTDLSKCTAAECEVDAGRKVGADLVVAGTVGRFSGKLLVRLKLFDTASAALLGQRSAQGSGLEAVRGKLGEEAKALFRVLRGRMSPGVHERLDPHKPAHTEPRIGLWLGSRQHGAPKHVGIKGRRRGRKQCRTAVQRLVCSAQVVADHGSVNQGRAVGTNLDRLLDLLPADHLVGGCCRENDHQPPKDTKPQCQQDSGEQRL